MDDEYEDKGGMDDEEEDDKDVGQGCGPSLAGDKTPAADQLLELLFQLSITFSTEQFTNGESSSSVLVFFSGILGFSSDAENFLPAKSYTLYLSGLIYVQRPCHVEPILISAFPSVRICGSTSGWMLYGSSTWSLALNHLWKNSKAFETLVV
jgi:hypothetical protein